MTQYLLTYKADSTISFFEKAMSYLLESSAEWMAEVPAGQLTEVADRIKAAADMGDVMTIQSIAAELKSGSDAVAPFCDELIRLAEDFDFDGIQKFMLKLDS